MAQAQAQYRWEFGRVSDQWPQAGLEGEVKLPKALLRQFRDCTLSYRLQALPGPFETASFSSNSRASCSSEKHCSSTTSCCAQSGPIITQRTGHAVVRET